MVNYDEIGCLYIKSLRITNTENIIFIANIILGLIISLYGNLPDKSIFVAIQIALTIIYFILFLIDDCLFWYQAEKIRRKSLIENSFLVNLTELKAKEYFDNDLDPSINKLIINSFESIFFSKTIASKMLFSESLKLFIVIITLIFISLTGASNFIILIITQALFSNIFLISFINLLVYKFKLENLYEFFYAEIITNNIKSYEQEIALLSGVLEYEAIKAHFKIRLSKRIFEKERETLNFNWKKLME